MSPDLKDLLDDAARSPRRGLDVDEIHRRGRRGRAVERTAGVTAAVTLLGVVMYGGAALQDSRPDLPVIGEQSPAATETAPPADELPVLDAVALGLDVLVTDGTRVVAHRADGSTDGFEAAEAPGDVWRFVSDGQGGFVYHPSSPPGETSEIVHVSSTGEERTLLVAGDADADLYALVGVGDGRPLVVDRSSQSVSLLEVDIENGETRVVRDDIATWPDEVYDATSLEVAAYIVSSTTSTRLIVDRPDAEPTTVSEVERGDGDALVDVVSDKDGRLYALLAERGGAYILQLDPFGDLEDVRRVTVPLDAAISSPEEVRATELSVADGWLVVNRAPGPNAETSALVIDTATIGVDGRGTWATLEPAGRALLARPGSDAHDSAAPACADHADLRNAAPTDDGTLDLYLTCAGETEPWHAYRRATAIEETGDVERDATAILDLLFTPVDDELADQGYSGLTFDVYDDGSGFTDPRLGSVTVTGTTAIIDFDAPDGYGFYGTSHAGSVFHTLVTANVLQLPGIDTVEIRNGGSCEAHSGMFESEGCFRFTLAADAPWNGDRVFD